MLGTAFFNSCLLMRRRPREERSSSRIFSRTLSLSRHLCFFSGQSFPPPATFPDYGLVSRKLGPLRRTPTRVRRNICRSAVLAAIQSPPRESSKATETRPTNIRRALTPPLPPPRSGAPSPSPAAPALCPRVLCLPGDHS